MVEDSLCEAHRGELNSRGVREREREGGAGDGERTGAKEVGRGENEPGRWTNRRSLTDVATPYVTFIADALLRHLLISSCSL